MDTRKDNANRQPIVANRRAPRKVTRDIRTEAQIVRTTSTTGGQLSISDDVDLGGDPYNSTGQHIVLKAKQVLPD
jgi:hypothetical protein